MLLCLPAHPAYPAPSAQATSFEQALKDIDSPDAGARQRAAQMLKSAAYPEAALPLAKLVLDPSNTVQLEAIAAELNIFLADSAAMTSRAGTTAETAFASGREAIGSSPVPLAVLAALRTAVRDETPRVAGESLYAFGALSAGADGAARRELLRVSGPELVGALGAADPAMRHAALNVIARVYERRIGDDPVDPTVGDPIVNTMNDPDRTLMLDAIHAAGAMRYERALRSLTEMFQYHGKGEMAEASFDAVARIAHPSSAALFDAQLVSKSAPIRGIAVEGIARLGDPARMPKLQTALARERDAGVLLAQAFAGCQLAKAPLDPIVDGLRKSGTRDQARKYFRELAPGHVQAFATALKDADPQVRVSAVDALGFSGDRAALPMVEAMAGDPDGRVASAAGRA
ncbi:MAG TPA: HEAT repeat domain-containing protein, partial [Vicinamibacterales bacterium]|nr:HEAT repeat domain-containing protein [Vicinamibacterales bacterium]